MQAGQQDLAVPMHRHHHCGLVIIREDWESGAAGGSRARNGDTMWHRENE